MADVQSQNSGVRSTTMELYVMAKAYDSYGCHSTFSPILEFLLQGADNFGSAIRELTLTFHFPTEGPPKKTLEQSYDAHHRNRETLPKVIFRRARGQMDIDVSSNIIDGREWKPSPRLSLPHFKAAVEEAIVALALMKKRIKASDDFDLAAFLAHCELARDRIPNSEDDLQSLDQQLQIARKAKIQAMSPWERLGVDWQDFHPRARVILNDPFFWETANDFSPNGNDTGADLLSEYRDWQKGNRDRDPMAFIDRLAKQWGYKDFVQMDEEIGDEAAIGLAFADIKLRGHCDERLRGIAMTAVARQRKQAEESLEWQHRVERLNSLKLIEAKLQQTSSGS